MKKLVSMFLTVLFFAGYSQAAIVQVAETGIATNSILNSSSGLYGTFNAGAFIPVGSQVTYGQAVFHFADNTDAQVYSQSSVVSQTGSLQYLHTVTNRYTDPYESASLQMGTMSRSGGTSSFSSTAFTGSTTTSVLDHMDTYSYPCGWHTCTGYTPVYATHTYNYYTQTDGYNGAFDLVFDILPGSAELQALNAVGQLDFLLQITGGDLMLSSALLTANTTDVSPSVPEPSALLLVGIGVIGVGLLRRKRMQ